MKKISKNIKETEQIAKKFLAQIKPNKTRATVVGLYGDLGVGKTTFTQFIAKKIGVKDKLKSPTFVIMKNYKLKTKNYKLFYHIDAYRLKNEKEFLHLGWEEILNNKEHLIFIEWPENVIKALPSKHSQVKISHIREGHREFKIKI